MNVTESMEMSGWGGYPHARVRTIRPRNTAEASSALPAVIARGQGRSYGDAALLTEGVVMLTDKLSGELHFDKSTGFLTANAGTTLAAILDSPETSHQFPAVVPGTKYVSLGGAVAADIHGKNHHRDGSFGDHVKELQLLLADGRLVNCSPSNNPDVFWATVGGMGLTGLITKVTFAMTTIESHYMVVRHTKAQGLDAALELCASSQWDDAYTVAWIDCVAKPRNLGRGIFMSGHHAKLSELPESFQRSTIKTRREYKIHFDFPDWLLNTFTIGAFNELYYRRQGSRSAFVCDYDSFFFPLDRIRNWHRLYGKSGFLQYQCVLPMESAEKGLKLLLAELSTSARSSYLAVLKRFGPANKGLLSFPMEGYTLALDFPIRDHGLFSFLSRLDAIVVDHGGRVYLAKDARLDAKTFALMYPNLKQWLECKAFLDPGNRYDSDLARRLGLRAST